MNMPCRFLASAVLAASAALLAAPAGAAPIMAPSSLQTTSAPSVEAVQWLGDWSWGRPAGYYDGYAYPGYGYPATPGYGYAPVPGYAPAPVAPGYATGYQAGAADVAFCMRRYRSYDPSTGTYIGRDRRTHSCP
jgi:BA14K-like protein